MTFADAIDRANTAVFRHLSDHTAVLDNVQVTGIFDNGSRQALDGLTGGVVVQDPTFTMPTAGCARARRGSTLRIDQVPYLVQEIEPDGTGVTVLRLSKRVHA